MSAATDLARAFNDLLAQPVATGHEERDRIRRTIQDIVDESRGAPVFDEMYARGWRAALKRVLDEIEHPLL